MEQVTCHACGEKMFTSENYCPKCRSPRLTAGVKPNTRNSLIIVGVAILLVMIAVVLKASGVFN